MKRGESSGRIDDNIEAIKKRFDTYVKETKPIIDEFGRRGKLVVVSIILFETRSLFFFFDIGQ